MKFSDLILHRQSVRTYQQKPVEREKLRALIEAVRLAPSASNSQPWTLIIIDDPALKGEVAKATISPAIPINKFVPQAPVIAVLLVERPKVITQVSAWLKKRQFPLIDIGIAAEHFCLQATELGLGTCMIGWFNEGKIKKLLHIPRTKRIGLLITVGYPPEGYQLRPKKRKEVGEMTRWNRYERRE